MDIKIIEENNREKNKVSDLIHKELLEVTEGRLGNSFSDIMFSPYTKYFYHEIDDILTKHDFNREGFYLRVLTSLAINNLLLPMFLSTGMYILGAERKDGKLKIHTIDGTYEAMQLAESLKIPYLLENKNLMSNSCYYFSQVLSVQEQYELCSSLCTSLYNGKYVHAYNINEEGLYCDGSRNLAMSEETFETLYKPDFQIYRMSSEEFLNDSLYHIDVENKDLSAYLIAKRELQKRF